MSEFDNPEDAKAAILSRKIEELENLLEQAESSNRPDPKIPILDDLVDYDEESVIRPNYSTPIDIEATQPLEPQFRPLPVEPEPEPEPISSAELDSLFNEIESKISTELDALVDILKDTIKDSVMNELKTRLAQAKEDKKI